MEQGDLQTIISSVRDSWQNFLASIPGIILGIIIVAIGYLIARRIGEITRTRIRRKSSDPLMSRFLGNTVKICLLLLAIIYAMNIAGLGEITTFLITSIGASAIIIGFAFKDIGENFISGIILAFSRPFNVNDTVEVGDLFGKIKSLEFRYTKLKTFDGRDVYIPNSDVLKKPVINYTEDGFFRWDFVVGIAYEDDVEAAKRVIMDTINSHPSVVQDGIHENYVAEDQLATSTVNLKVFFWVNTFEFRREAVMVRGEIMKQIKEALETGGFSMPSDIVELKLYSSQKDLPVKLQQTDQKQ
ncbi:mechanosensitive ion channel family protein [Echinicola strongylocentroti]|uniref:Mechanosensitive ion channel family protein n=1 Tax=Echinicola strongylocentroti TaxID=1795355 RepID=A0A2Z4II94_9BACT|nr:mechanosensitive ion channel family protein [Echinicola strongylocentroti]AWW30238.1 mechanosensitive ion channel family protein [Echinicola strongylocentroti]